MKTYGIPFHKTSINLQLIIETHLLHRDISYWVGVRFWTVIQLLATRVVIGCFQEYYYYSKSR